ncbi:MAG: Ig-like domain-containing protein, partial [Pseudomonadota bacterium]
DQTAVASGATVTLDGSASSDSDPGDSIASFAWAQTAGTGVTLSSTTIAGPTFTAPSLNVGDPSVTLTFELTVTDTQGAMDTDTVSSTVNAPGNNPPVADAGPDQTGVASGATVSLDGSASSDSDPGDSIASFAWTQTAGTSVTLSSNSVAGPTFTAPSLNVGDPSVTLTFELTVTDTQGAMATDTVSITVNAPIAPSDPTVLVVGNPDGTLTVSGNADPDTTVTVTFPDGSEAMTTALPDGTYTVTSPTPQTSGIVTAVSTDTDGNSSNPVSVDYVDTVAPQDPDVTVSDNDDRVITVIGTAEPRATVTVTFPDGSQGTDMVGPDGTYSVSSQDPQPDGPVTVVITDPAGNSSNPVTVPFSNGDVSPPTVEIIGAPQVSVDSFIVTIVFNEDVTGFELADVLVESGTATNFVAIDARNYRVEINPSREANTKINIPANVANDLAGNGNLAAAQVVVKSTIVEDTQQVISSFLRNRANHILNNQPDIIDFVLGGHIGKGGPLGSLNVNSNEQNLALAFSTSRSKILAARDSASTQVQDRIETSHAGINGSFENLSGGSERSLVSQYSSESENDRALTDAGQQTFDEEQSLAPSRSGTWDVWTEIYGSVSNSDTVSSSLWVGYLGAHYFISENQLLGIVGQLDWAEETDSSRNSNADGVGWMIGPYVAGRFDESDLYYEARVAYGLSSNDVSPIGTFTDGFDTERFLARAKLQGVYDLEEFVISPSITFSYYEETQSDYTDTFGNVIPEQTISLGELRFGPEIGRTFTLDSGTQIHASLGISGIYNFAVENNVSTQGFAPGDEEIRARLDAGFGFDLANGSVVRLEGYYDGIGANDYESIGGGIRITIPLE